MPFSLADIDYFKRVNDNYGHLVGDDVLRFIAEIFSKNLRAHDFIARYGGEEFIFLLPSTSLDQAFIAAEKIRKTVAESPHPVAGAVTVSIGIAEASPGQANEDLVIQEADQRLYEAKKHGRNRVVGLKRET
jgi:diguanylate cyclase (GGDEF)-like protein